MLMSMIKSESDLQDALLCLEERMHEAHEALDRVPSEERLAALLWCRLLQAELAELVGDTEWYYEATSSISRLVYTRADFAA